MVARRDRRAVPRPAPRALRGPRAPLRTGRGLGRGARLPREGDATRRSTRSRTAKRTTSPSAPSRSASASTRTTLGAASSDSPTSKEGSPSRWVTSSRLRTRYMRMARTRRERSATHPRSAGARQRVDGRSLPARDRASGARSPSSSLRITSDDANARCIATATQFAGRTVHRPVRGSRRVAKQRRAAHAARSRTSGCSCMVGATLAPLSREWAGRYPDAARAAPRHARASSTRRPTST